MRKLLACVAAVFVLVIAAPADAKMIRDPEGTMSWDDYMACQLVVVGKYAKHGVGNVSIKVERVLVTPKNIDGHPDVKVGDVIDIGLEHWWSVEEGPVGVEAIMEDGKSDGKPRLCYKLQVENPGPLAPFPVMGPDQSMLFFVPAHPGTLRRSGQVLSAVMADGWEQALTGKKMDLAFRLTQNLNESLRAEAMEELKKSRDPKAMAKLVELIVADTDKQRGMIYTTLAQQQLIALGDKDGDLYDILLKNVDPALKQLRSYQGYRITEIMAMINPDKAMKQFKEWLGKEQRAELRSVATNGLAWIPTQEAMNLAIDLVADKDVGALAVNSVRSLILPNAQKFAKFEGDRRLELWKIAKRRLTDPEPPASLEKNQQDTYRWLIKSELSGDAPPQ